MRPYLESWNGFQHHSGVVVADDVLVAVLGAVAGQPEGIQDTRITSQTAPLCHESKQQFSVSA